jgi:hypothetical protein
MRAAVGRHPPCRDHHDCKGAPEAHRRGSSDRYAHDRRWGKRAGDVAPREHGEIVGPVREPLHRQREARVAELISVLRGRGRERALCYPRDRPNASKMLNDLFPFRENHCELLTPNCRAGFLRKCSCNLTPAPTPHQQHRDRRPKFQKPGHLTGRANCQMSGCV